MRKLRPLNSGAETYFNINEGWPAYEKALQENDIEYTQFMYPDVNHGFHNTSTPRYDPEAAELSWKRSIDFFIEHLK